MSPSIDVLCRGKRPVWGDVVVVEPTEVVVVGPDGGRSNSRPSVAGRVRYAGSHLIQVDDQQLRSGQLVSVEVVQDMDAQEILHHLRQVSAALAVTATWHGPEHSPIWKAHWEGVEQKDRSILRPAIAFGNSPEEALRDLWWLATTAASLVWDAYGTRGGRQEFRFDGPEGRWVNLEQE